MLNYTDERDKRSLWQNESNWVPKMAAVPNCYQVIEVKDNTCVVWSKLKSTIKTVNTIYI